MTGPGKSGHLGWVGAGMTVFSYFRRIRVQAVGTEQITPPLPNDKGSPCGALFYLEMTKV